MVVVKAHFCIAAQKLGKEIVLICNTRALLMEQKSTPGLHKGHILTSEPLVQKNNTGGIFLVGFWSKRHPITINFFACEVPK